MKKLIFLLRDCLLSAPLLALVSCIFAQALELAKCVSVYRAMKFSLDKAVAGGGAKLEIKRPIEEQPGRRAKMAKASEVLVEDGPKPAQTTPRKLSANAPVNVTIYKTSDDAGDIWEAYRGTGLPLYQVQISQASARSITYQFKEKINDFLRVSPDFPDSLQELQDDGGIRLVIGDKNVSDLALPM